MQVKKQQNWTWNNGLVQNWEMSIVIQIIHILKSLGSIENIEVEYYHCDLHVQR